MAQTITLNLNLMPGSIPPIIHLSQYDRTARMLSFNLMDETGTYVVPSNAAVTIRGTKPDKTGFEVPCTVSGEAVRVAVDEQMTVCAGKVPCEIRIEDTTDHSILGTANFLLDVKGSALSDDTLISKTELPLLEQAVQAVQPTLENAHAAAASASAAKMSETNAKESETASKASQSAAKTSESNAKVSETNASASEANAASSAAKAAKSQTTASGFAQSSKDNADKAEQYKTEASASAVDAASSASAAQQAVDSFKPMTGATSTTAGTAGIVPAPAAGEQDSVLKGDGTWSTSIGGVDIQELKNTVEENTLDRVIVKSYTGSNLSSSMGNITITAPDVDGYQFVCWLFGTTTNAYEIADGKIATMPLEFNDLGSQTTKAQTIFSSNNVYATYLVKEV